MNTKTPPPRPAALTPQGAALVRPWQSNPVTTEQRLECIELMGQRISAYVLFMRQLGDLNGTSGEAKEKAVAAFYERMVVLERQLGRIQEDLQLG